jgi:hypothetical protein
MLIHRQFDYAQQQRLAPPLSEPQEDMTCFHQLNHFVEHVASIMIRHASSW